MKNRSVPEYRPSFSVFLLDSFDNVRRAYFSVDNGVNSSFARALTLQYFLPSKRNVVISRVYRVPTSMFPLILSSTSEPHVCYFQAMQGGPKSKLPPIFQKIVLKIANEIGFLRKVKV